MLKKQYYIDTKNFKCNKNTNIINSYLDVTIYHSLNEFINDYKQYYDNTLNEKIRYYKNEHLNPYFETFTFNDIFSDFISWFLYELKIGKNENVTIHKYDDTIIIYTKNECFSYVFYD